MIIVVAADHAGFNLKQKLVLWLKKKRFDVVDVGADRFIAKDDYPIYASMGAKAVKNANHAKGIFICGSGVGMTIQANRFKGIRAFSCESSEVARRACDEDDANVLVLGARIVAEKDAKKIISTFLRTPFSGHTRHRRRLRLIERG